MVPTKLPTGMILTEAIEAARRMLGNSGGGELVVRSSCT